MAKASNHVTSSLVELMSELSITRYNIGSCHLVEVTHINKPDDFYVRPTAYYSHLDKLQSYGGPVDASKLILGKIVVYESQLKNRHVRGQIRRVRDDKGNMICDMFALDYGFMESVSADCLKNSNHEGMAALTLHCQLELCQPKGREFDEKAIAAMKFFVGDEVAKIIVKGQIADKLIVQLINSCPDDISTMLAYSEDTVLGHGQNSVNRFTCPNLPKLFFTYKQLKVGDSMRVQVQSGDSLQNFYVADIKEYREHSRESGNLSKYLKLQSDMRPEDLMAGKPVAVRNDYNGFDRAVIKEVTVPGEKAIVQLVDSGKIVEINVLGSRLKALEREYYFLQPALAIYCSTDDKQAWDNGLRRFLYPGYQFTITVKKVGKDHQTPHIVNLTKISK